MYVDAQTLYSDSQAITASAASTNLVDHEISRDLGTGQDVYLVAVVDVAFTDAGSDSTVQVDLQSDNDVAFGSVDNTQTIGTFAATSAVGTTLIAKLQPGQVDSRYTRINYTVANGNLTTGSITAFLTTDVQNYTAYADNYTITS
jgi:hypothetical protein